MAKQVQDLEKKAAQSTTAITDALGVGRGDLLRSVAVMAGYVIRQPKPFIKNAGEYGKEVVKIVKGESELAPASRDRRFMDPTWKTNRLYKAGLQNWLAAQRSLEGWIDDSGIAEKDKARSKYILELVADTLSPTNTLLGNPAAMKRLFETGGVSAVNGIKNFYDDIRNNGGMPSMVDKSKFEVGKNLAMSKGSVIFKNEMMEIIQYAPLTEEVYKIPLVVIPPQINKFYANDLSDHNSMVKFLTKQGFQVFAVSWRNPTRQHSHWGMDNYVQSLIEGTDAVMKITKSKKLNLTGACSGGITLALLLNELKVRGDERVNSFTLMVCVLDPEKRDSDVGLFANQAGIEYARKRSRNKGILSGEELSKVFAWLRPNDLIWNYVVNNYLLGDQPPAFDILYWNCDSTNLSAQLHSDYLDMSLDNRFRPAQEGEEKQPVEFMGHEIDLNKIDADCFMLAGITDHITPWRACYRNTAMFGGDIEFVLASSGHIQSLLSAPGNPKFKYLTNSKITKTSDEWLESTSENSGSWWLHWSEWMKKRSVETKKAPRTLGNKPFPPLSKAPGEYVFT